MIDQQLVHKLESSLAAAVAVAGAVWAASALATADGPDYFAVSAETSVNLRAGPSTGAAKIALLAADSRGLKNLGCHGLPSQRQWERMSPRQRQDSRKHFWCKVSYQGLEGWVAGQYLHEDGPPPPAANP